MGPSTILDVGKERLKNYAESFGNLAKVFSIEGEKEDYSREYEFMRMCEDIEQGLCAFCERGGECARSYYPQIEEEVQALCEEMIQNGRPDVLTENSYVSQNCIHYRQFVEECIQSYERLQMENFWHNRVLESREAMVQQLKAMSDILKNSIVFQNEITEKEEKLVRRIERVFSKHPLMCEDIHIVEGKHGRWEIYLTLFAKNGKCVTVRTIADHLSKLCGKRMRASKNSRQIVAAETVTIVFVEMAKYQVLTGMARYTKKGEAISGDNYCFLETEEKETICLSDGMGSGIRAFQESGKVVDLLEKFLESGFDIETSVKMINSAMVLEGENHFFSTIDICSIDLYSGLCNFLKIGAAASFVKYKNQVEIIWSDSLPGGFLQKLDIEKSARKLQSGDFIIMISDGLLDGLEEPEQMLAEIIKKLTMLQAKEMAKEILRQIVQINGYRVDDDMTVLVAGIWKECG